MVERSERGGARRALARCGLVVALASVVAQPVVGEPTPRTISVNGHAEVAVSPDRAVISVAVETEGMEAGKVVEQNAQRSAKVTEAVKALIAAEDRVTTTGYSVQPRYSQGRPGEIGEPKIVGYVASNEVVVETRRIDATGRIIDATIAAGANRINNLRFTLADRAPYLRVALEQASKEAQAQAEAIAKAMGVKLKQLLSAGSSGPPIVAPRQMDMFRAKSMAAMAVDTPITPGEVSVSADVQAIYEIQ